MNSTMILFFVFVAIVVAWIIFYNLRRKRIEAEEEERKARLSEEERIKEEEAEKAKEESSECCGQHEVCEKTNLININLKIEYYDDEELDALSGKDPEDYTEEEIAQLREVFETLKEYDVAGWLRSLQLRNIVLPEDIKEEALFIVSDLRDRENAK
ncbi:MAG: phospholipase [Paludibacteraceae bacterium]|nr:phospholipase [Paludibacteraceae bacterium]